MDMDINTCELHAVISTVWWNTKGQDAIIPVGAMQTWSAKLHFSLTFSAVAVMSDCLRRANFPLATEKFRKIIMTFSTMVNPYCEKNTSGHV